MTCGFELISCPFPRKILVIPNVSNESDVVKTFSLRAV